MFHNPYYRSLSEDIAARLPCMLDFLMSIYSNLSTTLTSIDSSIRSFTRPIPGIFRIGRSRINFLIASRSNGR